MLEHKFCDPEAKLVVTDSFEIAGYASVFERVDRGGDSVASGAYAASLKRLAEAERSVKMLWQHDPAQPIGVWDEIREDAHGLFVKGRLLPNVARAAEAAALVGAGAIDGLSIGYRTVRAEKGASGGRKLTEIDLWEVSLVTFPMLSDARVGTKADDRDEALMRDLSTMFARARSLMASG